MRLPTRFPEALDRARRVMLLVVATIAAAGPAAAQSPAIAPEAGAGRGILVGRPDIPAAVASDDTPTSPSVALSFVRDTVAPGTYPARFATLAGGVRSLNDAEFDRWRNYAAEQRYERDSVTPGMTIAEGVVLDGEAEASAAARLLGRGAIELTLVGHLEEAEMPQAHPDSVVLWLDVERAGVRSTHAVRARDLFRGSPGERYERYQQVAVRLDAVAVATDALSTASIPGIRVRFVGAATVALNRIELRSDPPPVER